MLALLLRKSTLVKSVSLPVYRPLPKFAAVLLLKREFVTVNGLSE